MEVHSPGALRGVAALAPVGGAAGGGAELQSCGSQSAGGDENHGKTMGKLIFSWENHRKTMGKPHRKMEVYPLAMSK